MKTNNIIPIVCGCVALIICAAEVLLFESIASAISAAENNFTKVFAGVIMAMPFIALLACVYFVIKGTK